MNCLNSQHSCRPVLAASEYVPVAVWQQYLVDLRVMLPHTRSLVLPPAEGRNLAPHIARPRCSGSAILREQHPRWGWGVPVGVIGEQRGLRAVAMGGGGGSLAGAMHGLEGSGSGLRGGQVKVVHPSGGGVQHGGVVVCLWALTLTAHLQHAKLIRKGKSRCLGSIQQHLYAPKVHEENHDTITSF